MSRPPAPPDRGWRRLAAPAVVLLALASTLTGLRNGFTYDDGHIVLANPRVHEASNALGLFAQTYWPPNTGSALYRPLTMLAFLGQWLAGDGSPFPFHLVNTLAYAGLCVAVLALAARLLPLPAAFVAAALFAVHPVHVEVTGNVVGQSELWVGLSLVLGTVAYLRLRRRQLAGEPAGREAAAVLALFAAGCLAKEHGVVLPGVLGAAELIVVAASARHVPWRARLRQVAPLYVGLLVVAVAFVAVRAHVVGGLYGESPHISFDGRSTAARLWTVLGVSGEWLRLLLWPAHLAAVYGPPGTTEYDGFAPELLAPALALAGLLALALWAWRARPALAFGLAWTFITLLPTSNLLFPTGLLLAERSLFAPSVGAMIAVGDGAVWLIGRLRAAGPRAVRLGAVGFAVLLAAGAVRSARRQFVWENNAYLFGSAVADEPLSYKAQYAFGDVLMAVGQKAEGERRIRFAMRLMPRDSDMRVHLADAYRRSGLCWPAVPLYEEAMRISPRRPDARVGKIACLLSLGRYEDARAEARLGLAQGYVRGTFRQLIEVGDSLVARGAPGAPGGRGAQ